MMYAVCIRICTLTCPRWHVVQGRMTLMKKLHWHSLIWEIDADLMISSLLSHLLLFFVHVLCLRQFFFGACIASSCLTSCLVRLPPILCITQSFRLENDRSMRDDGRTLVTGDASQISQSGIPLFDVFSTSFKDWICLMRVFVARMRGACEWWEHHIIRDYYSETGSDDDYRISEASYTCCPLSFSTQQRVPYAFPTTISCSSFLPCKNMCVNLFYTKAGGWCVCVYAAEWFENDGCDANFVSQTRWAFLQCARIWAILETEGKVQILMQVQFSILGTLYIWHES